ncbi:MAG: hypothetical protein RSA40_01085 [Malacoplasma sp.]
MNLVAMIGIVDSIKRKDDITNILLKVEKPFLHDAGVDDFYDKINVNLNNTLFKDFLKIIAKGSLIGLKGRIVIDNELNKIQVDKLQIF